MCNRASHGGASRRYNKKRKSRSPSLAPPPPPTCTQRLPTLKPFRFTFHHPRNTAPILLPKLSHVYTGKRTEPGGPKWGPRVAVDIPHRALYRAHKQLNKQKEATRYTGCTHYSQPSPPVPVQLGIVFDSTVRDEPVRQMQLGVPPGITARRNFVHVRDRPH